MTAIAGIATPARAKMSRSFSTPRDERLDAVMCEDVSLAFGSRRSVAPHGGKHEGFRPAALPVLDHAFDNGGDIGNAPAADADCNPRARFQIRSKTRRLKLPPGLAADILERAIGEVLPDKQERRKIHDRIISGSRRFTV